MWKRTADFGPLSFFATADFSEKVWFGRSKSNPDEALTWSTASLVLHDPTDFFKILNSLSEVLYIMPH